MDESEPVILATQSVDELIETLNQAEGEGVLYLQIPNRSSQLYIRVYNDNIWSITTELVDSEDERYEVASDEISRDRFETLLQSADVVVLKPRKNTPFSRDTQRKLREESDGTSQIEEGQPNLQLENS